MDKDELLKMTDNPDLIPGIYNYCDRWCERCSRTSRCLLFQTEKKRERSGEPSSGTGECDDDFWEAIRESFSLARQMLEEFAEEEGIDLDEAMEDEEVRAAVERSDRRQEAARLHPCFAAAEKYYGLVNGWFSEAEDLWNEKLEELLSSARLELPGRDPEKEARELSDLAEVIRWYQYFISAKVLRALSGKAEEAAGEWDEDWPSDADGSAKIALIAIDRSIGAWNALLSGFPESQDDILEILVLLDRLRRNLEAVMPRARSFIRPGFDE